MLSDGFYILFFYLWICIEKRRMHLSFCSNSMTSYPEIGDVNFKGAL